jgi:hypothetical protein
VVAQEWLRRAAADAPGRSALAAGLLVAAERDAASRGRTEWQAVWDRLDRKPLRAWL